MDLQVKWSRDGGVLVASLSGRIDSGNCADFEDALKEGIPEGERGLALDCGQLAYMSSAGLRVLLDLTRRFSGPGRAMGLCGLPQSIESVVRLSGFDKIIPVHDSIADAVAAISGKVGDVREAVVEEVAEEAVEESPESSRRFSFRLGKRSTKI